MTPEEIKQHSLTSFLNEASIRFDVGQRQHGGCLADRECFMELGQELIDAWHYFSTEKLRREKREQYIQELESEVYRLRGICDSFRVTAAVPI